MTLVRGSRTASAERNCAVPRPRVLQGRAPDEAHRHDQTSPDLIRRRSQPPPPAPPDAVAFLPIPWRKRATSLARTRPISDHVARPPAVTPRLTRATDVQASCGSSNTFRWDTTRCPIRHPSAPLHTVAQLPTHVTTLAFRRDHARPSCTASSHCLRTCEYASFLRQAGPRPNLERGARNPAAARLARLLLTAATRHPPDSSRAFPTATRPATLPPLTAPCTGPQPSHTTTTTSFRRRAAAATRNSVGPCPISDCDARLARSRQLACLCSRHARATHAFVAARVAPSDIRGAQRRLAPVRRPLSASCTPPPRL